MRVGWDNNVLAAAFPRRHTCCHIVSRCGGWGWVGWDNNVLEWGGVGWGWDNKPHSRTLLSHPTQPHPPRIWRRCGSTYVDEGTQLQGRYCPTPPNPTPQHLERMPCSVWPQVWRGFWFLNRVDGGCGIVFFVSESSFFGCGIVFFGCGSGFFWVAEAYMFLVAESPKFGCGSVEIWFRNRNLFHFTHRSSNFSCSLNFLEFKTVEKPCPKATQIRMSPCEMGCACEKPFSFIHEC